MQSALSFIVLSSILIFSFIELQVTCFVLMFLRKFCMHLYFLPPPSCTHVLSIDGADDEYDEFEYAEHQSVLRGARPFPLGLQHHVQLRLLYITIREVWSELDGYASEIT